MMGFSLLLVSISAVLLTRSLTPLFCGLSPACLTQLASAPALVFAPRCTVQSRAGCVREADCSSDPGTPAAPRPAHAPSQARARLRRGRSQFSAFVGRGRSRSVAGGGLAVR